MVIPLFVTRRMGLNKKLPRVLIIFLKLRHRDYKAVQIGGLYVLHVGIGKGENEKCEDLI